MGIIPKTKPETSSVDNLLNYFNDDNDLSTLDFNNTYDLNPAKSNLVAPSDFVLDLSNKKQKSSTKDNFTAAEESKNPNKSKNEKKNSAWFDLFADLDPLANPTNMEKKLSSLNKMSLDA